jgi:hypothetical protein
MGSPDPATGRKGAMMRQSLYLAALATCLGGCATLIHGPMQDVRVESDPPGATATITPMQSERGPAFLDPNKKITVTTPATVRLRRDNTYRVELEKPGYKFGTTKVTSSYDWLWAPTICNACEAIGELPSVDMKGRPLPLRFAEAAFYEYPKGFLRAWGRGLRIFSPEALLGTGFKLKSEEAGPLSDWHAVGTPTVSTTLEPVS